MDIKWIPKFKRRNKNEVDVVDYNRKFEDFKKL
ncbi:MAG: hypothetical protein BWY55_00953 [archaeon ADurb.Bin336]|nr:MAG: hypothetical protein BWY55_00953 [archaeon ADurb.Bin336]